MSCEPNAFPDLETLGIDFGGTSVKMGVCRGADLLEKLEPLPTQEFDGAEPLIQEMESIIQRVRSRRPQLVGVGIGLPGFVDFRSGCVNGLSNVRGWEGVNLRDRLRKSTGLAVIVENDANAMAYAEWRFGAGQGCNDLLAITLGTGVGGGLILGGKIYRGDNSGAGEVGQITIDYHSTRLGEHGNAGALEKYVGNQQFTERAFARYQSEGTERSWEECAPDKIAGAANAGDEIARKLWEDFAEELAAGLANVLWILNLNRVVIGGGMAKAGDLLFEPLRVSLKTQMHPVFTRRLTLVPAHFSNEAGLIGAAALAAIEAISQKP